MIFSAKNQKFSCWIKVAQSQQLARLRAEGLVETRRDGKNVFYSLARPEIRDIISALHRAFCPPPPRRFPAAEKHKIVRAAAPAKAPARSLPSAPVKRLSPSDR